MNSPTRRVLGNKDANTHLHSRTHQALTSPERLKPAVDGGNLMRVPGMPSSKSASVSGLKRKIEEVEDAERVGHGRPSDSQRTILLDESDSEIESQDVSMSTFQRSYETAGTSFLGSQNIVEPQFEIPQDEMSQRTLDKLNAVPLPQNTSQLPPWQPTLLNDTSAGSIGLSAYFNLDDQTSTQGSDGLQMLETVVKAQIPETHDGPEVAPKRIESKNATTSNQDVPTTSKPTVISTNTVLPSIIEAAKTRLQLAMYKVQTKQVHKPFSRLKHEPHHSPKSFNQPRLISPPGPAATSKSLSSDATITLEIYHRDSQHLRNNLETGATREKEDHSDTSQNPRRPRSESVIADSRKNSQSTNLDTQNFLSSPPLSRQHSTDSLEELLPPNNGINSSQRSSQGSGKHTAQSLQQQQQQQLSSPPISDSGRDPSASLKAQQIGQGEAATGLLQLMTGGAGLCGV